ncbi:TMEM175 family protein [uncultured Methanobrevibacter sp.]|uniref:TMEM175 family protein n=1 Tax=uncultured Methanobrevibacter sp. TaxID=253161 RepID=UPI0025F60730|nr:TMEM175 family protein [uncultured Methanobrevibacter sp.]
METDRFEALGDGILAIIITLIILEIPLPSTPSFAGLWNMKLEFLAYFISFLVVFNMWNSHHNLFNLIHKLHNSTVWMSGISLLILGFLPYFTTMVSNNFYSFFAQGCFGFIFVISHIHYILQAKLLTHNEPGNIALIVYLENGVKYSYIELIIFAIIYILGYFIYPPIIMVGCLLAMIFWIFNDQLLPLIKN